MQLELDVTKDVIERRVDRAACPSPDDEAAAGTAAKAPPVPRFTAVNAQAGPAPRLGPVTEKVLMSEPDSRGSASPSRTASPSSTVPAQHRDVDDREWEVCQIVDKQFTHGGVVRYLVRWAATTHPAAVLRHGEGGDVTVVVDGQDFAVCQYSTGAADEATGEQQRIVEWKTTWHNTWELADAIRLVRKYEQAHEPVYGSSDKELKQSRKDLVLQHPHWNWPMTFKSHHDQEHRPDPAKRRDILKPDFVPEPGADYTASFWAWQTDEIVSGQCQIPSAARFLNRPLRQYLQFNGDYFAEELHRTYNAGTTGKLTALYAHMVGLAHRVKCTNCQNLEVPFSKCVTLSTSFSGACTCCQYLNKGQECTYHHHYREFYEEQIRKDLKREREWDPTQLEQHANIEDDGYNSSDSEDSGYGGSSPARHDAAAIDADSRQRIDKGKAPARDNPAASRGGSAGDDQPSQDPAMNNSQESAGSVLDQARRERRNKKRKIMKTEAQNDSLSSEASWHPGSCGRSWQICRHPTIGHVRPPIEDGSLHPPNVVFNNQRFSAGEATDEQVRYIISCSTCQNTTKLEKAWQDALEEARTDGEVLDIGKETYLSHLFADWLNEIVKMACPTPSLPPRVDIDLTLDDD